MAGGNIDLAALVGKDKAAVGERPFGYELTANRVDRSFRVGLEVSDACAEVFERDAHQPSLESVVARDADVNRLAVAAAQVAVDASSNAAFVLSVNGLETICHVGSSSPRVAADRLALFFIGDRVLVGNALFAANRVGIVVGSEGVFQEVRKVAGNPVPDGAVADAVEVLADQVVNVLSELRQDCVAAFLNAFFLG